MSVTKILNVGELLQQLLTADCLPEASGTVPTRSQMSAGPTPSHKDDQMVIEKFSTSSLRSLVSSFRWEVTGTHSFCWNIFICFCEYSSTSVKSDKDEDKS